ncbi:Rad59p NDAI_0D04410 [Naumovozyma dairenensis CBS 421]|uniref:DNA repair protein RAD59 n=1 Tax=Naumovozyma dairenensis (strain ATCC 10597 / BCRC 20456 / CBS 421 / NBRC 0211 / NRRL Y-12639) TaxID=1071378 RepID=G0WAE4_NAUDC|nr:hypothetical protein NDAI_0D04410 [Naumovozyma dairenensis CBS 421]CCD24755.1 hypothetical protein NDAI_0D04410 [Naumovozyma dairenensis CBS 421]
MSSFQSNHVSYEGTVYSTRPGLELQDFQLEEDWNGRPASEWSVTRIGILQSKIEKYTYKIYHSNRFGKHNLSKLIARHKLVEFANETFGFDGWHMDVIDIDARELLNSSAKVNLTKTIGTNTNNNENSEDNDRKPKKIGIKDDEESKDNDNGDHNIKHTVLAEAQVRITLKDGTNTQMGGIGKATMPFKGDSFSKAKKEAVNDALKKALLSFEKIILDYETKVENNYYVDGLYVNKIKQTNFETIHDSNTNNNDISVPSRIKQEEF